VPAVSTYWKVPFEWTHGEAPMECSPAGWRWEDDRTITVPPVELVAAVLGASSGPEDRLAVERLGPSAAAERVLALDSGFSYLERRWHVLTIDGRQAGFVLPVVYDGCARDGLDEATIYHMATAPTYRGRGVGVSSSRPATGSVRVPSCTSSSTTSVYVTRWQKQPCRRRGTVCGVLSMQVRSPLESRRSMTDISS
jgi:GNAT superfamily N-acetyltransferase